MRSSRLFSVALAILLAAGSGVAGAQGFSSVSSGKPLPDAAPSEGAPSATAPSAAPTAVTPAPPLASQSEPVSAEPATGSAAPAVPATGSVAPVEPRATDTPPAACAPPNPFLTGTAALEAEKQCLALNPFLSTAGQGDAPGATAAAATTVPFGGPQAASPRRPEPADRVLVKKSERRLYLLRDDRVIADYPIKLGLSPKGPKQREGDYRTPEGTYEIASRNARSDFFLSLGVSYPNEADLERAKESGVRPGGLIMIHGQPNTPRKPPDWYANNDWTDGCIAVSNSDMVDIWLRTAVGVPIEISP